MKVEEFLQKQGVAFRTHEHPPAYTAQEVAAEEHVSGNLMAKAVLVKAGEKYLLCALPASYKLDLKKVAKAAKAKSARLADEQEMAKLFPDCEVGAEPPMGNLFDLPTLLDQHLAEDEEIVFQGGTHRLAIRMKYADYAALVKPQVADLAVHL